VKNKVQFVACFVVYLYRKKIGKLDGNLLLFFIFPLTSVSILLSDFHWGGKYKKRGISMDARICKTPRQAQQISC
jgi:hypothetical protein